MIIILLSFAFYNIILFFIFIGIVLFVSKRIRAATKRRYSDAYVISFLHPFCNDCGGGEKVLWMMVKKLYQEGTNKKIKINILSCIKDSLESITKNLNERFDIELKDKASNVIDLEIIRLKHGSLLKPRGFFTMFLQIIGQIYLAFEIVTKTSSDVIIDTTGYPFTYSLLSFFGSSRVYAYVHYPFISHDMIKDIKEGIQGVHSRGVLSKLPFMKHFKIFYYNIILYLYKFNGHFVNFAFTNSSWTHNHMKSLWSTKLERLYPPCKILTINESTIREKSIVSFAQFRPEKRHKFQVDIIRRLKDKGIDIKLHMIGSTRGEDDKRLLAEIKHYISEQGLDNNIIIHENYPIGKIKEIFNSASIGIHTMRDEHFGISIIEMMAAGLYTIAHKSAGPLNDIIGGTVMPVGFLADCIYN
jgi:alpha-1,2-mannosyltransferase